ncbi:MAG TPA: Holliday junction branch migration protein RuvA [Eubacteriaceae bacterium]|nr:Holliday junction branch migration protein RuvA [Eubacteriaceae bacterium]
MVYEYIKGYIQKIQDDKLILECKEIGYVLTISANTQMKLPKENEKAKVYVYQHVREDELTLYGFCDVSERDFFKDLISISGIGPKVAIGILSQFRFEQFAEYVIEKNEKAISQAPGIGKKTANRIILELGDKYKKLELVLGSTREDQVAGIPDGKNAQEAVEALVSLGYRPSEGEKLIASIENLEELSVEEIIKQALVKASV